MKGGEYLIQERNESCVMYTNINENQRSHYSHLFFTNGNGVEFSDGNPVALVSFYREVLWTEYYKHTMTLDYLKEVYIDRHLEADVEQTIKLVGGKHKDVWRESLKAVEDIPELTIDNMLSTEYWYSTFTVFYFFPRLALSDGYFKLQELNEHTEITLLKLASAFVSAYIKFFTEVIANKKMISDYKPILRFEWTEKDIDSVYRTCISDKAMLEKEKDKIDKLIKQVG